ncbi:hypothetical protein [Pseudoalteromonas sp.]|uniref:hypothetical protein n=1 Tax=Pseudoalteromonas TaxID=53246 RepID=UPI003F98C9EB
MLANNINHEQAKIVYEDYLTALATEVDSHEDNIAKLKFNVIVKQLSQVINNNPKVSYTFNGEVQFKEIFAYARSNAMFDALSHVLPPEWHPVGLVFTDAYNQPVHYFHKVIINCTTYFIDAFGLYEDADLIKSRYGRSLITGVRRFDVTDKRDVYHDGYKTLQTENEQSIAKIANAIDCGSRCEVLYFELVSRLFTLVLNDNKFIK